MQTGLYIFESITTKEPEERREKSPFPNPAKDKFTLLNTHAKTLTLYNTVGEKVKEQKLNTNQNTIYKGNLADGLYFYSLNNGNTLIDSGKVIFE